VDEGLHYVLDGVGVELEPTEWNRFSRAYQLVLSRTLTEPRPISRFLAQIDALLTYVRPDEINVVDFLLLTYVRVTYPGLHRRLRADRGLLTGDDMQLTVARRDQTDPYDWSTLLAHEGVPDAEAVHIHGLLAHLFPGAAPAPKDVWLLGDFKPGVRRVGDPAYFERYFALGVTEDDLSDTTIRDALIAIGRSQLSPARTDLEQILSPAGGAVGHLQAKALTKLIQLGPPSTGADTREIIRFLLAVYPDLSDDDQTILSPSVLAVDWQRASSGGSTARPTSTTDSCRS
jgi:hypothetical protein